jgi:hypothetical protein
MMAKLICLAQEQSSLTGSSSWRILQYSNSSLNDSAADIYVTEERSDGTLSYSSECCQQLCMCLYRAAAVTHLEAATLC